MSEVGRARMRLAKAVTLSYEGENAESRRHIRDAMQLLDAALEEEVGR